MSTLGTDAQVETLADLLIACGAAEEPLEVVRALYAGWLDAITLGRADDVLELVAESVRRYEAFRTCN
jgi:hypothetical protein